jgi:hypothetical protein
MRKLSSLILAMAFSVSLFSQSSPHGDDFTVSCTDCHNTEGWKIDLKTLSFNHNSTKFPLIGQHQSVNCKLCHTSLVFSKAGKECISCHTDMHNQTVGPDCARCHTPNSWIINNITEIHQRSRFPLVGPHVTADCYDCHINASASLLNFGPLGVECIDCHQANYASTTAPNHAQAGYSTNCTDCHSMNSFTWGAKIDHSFFPLQLGHAIDCKQCHTTGTFTKLPAECISCHQANYNATTNPNHASLQFPTACDQCHSLNPGWQPASFNHGTFPLTLGHSNVDCSSCHPNGSYTNTSSECVSCHQANYNATTNPNHINLQFSTDCNNCHNTNPGWKPAEYREHDTKSFPIYSGKHNGTWSNCSECHTNPSNYAQFTCIDCHDHNQADMSSKHQQVSGYVYNSIACFECHPTGSAEGAFNHSNSIFPLTGAHTTVECASCHTNGFGGTTTVCYDCHTNQYNQSTNPNHIGINIPKDCGTCHTTNPGWNPATFPIHNNYYVLAGAHLTIANNCVTCHQGNYVNTPNLCFGCHATQYNQTTNPNHITSQFPTTCETCHSQIAWSPSTFNHSNVYPLTGAHAAIANNCFACHQGNYVNTPNTCVGCHLTNYNQTTNPNHFTSQFPTTCETCHSTTAWSPSTFNHNNVYPLTGAHLTIANDCFACHQGNYVNTPNTCVGCHQANYNQTTNPNHGAISIPTTCATCHTTNPNWTPATFPIHNNYYVLAGAHVAIANQCVLCHNGNYNSTPNTCVGCHLNDYNQTNNPNHAAAQFPTTCLNCHTQTAWTPANWNHDGLYFPIYSGKHNGKWSACSDCHTNPANYAVFTCTTSCHPQSQMNNSHQGVSGYSYNSAACYNCHPNGSAPKMMDKINNRN